MQKFTGVFLLVAMTGCGGGLSHYNGSEEKLLKEATERFIVRQCRNVIDGTAVLPPKPRYYLATEKHVSYPTETVVVEDSEQILLEINNLWVDEKGFTHYFGWGAKSGMELVLPKPPVGDVPGAPGRYVRYGATPKSLSQSEHTETVPLRVDVDSKGIGRPASSPVIECELDLIT